MTKTPGSLTLEALPSAIASAREHARMIVGGWAMASMAEDVTLIVSELVTNAVAASSNAGEFPKYTDTTGGVPEVRLRMWSDRTRIVVEVWDGSPRSPVTGQQEPDAEEGRGLLLVEALSERWGWNRTPGRSGKVVWAEISVQ